MKIKTEVEMTPEEAKELMLPSEKQIDLGTSLYQQWLDTVTESAFNIMNSAYSTEDKKNV